jgi:uncharacterized protein
MTKEIWINLPVKDIEKSREFFTKIGFTLHHGHKDSSEAVGLMIGEKNVMVMLFPESTFKKFTKNEISDTKQATEVLFSVDAESREEVDKLIEKAVQAGGIAFSKPQEQDGWMYGAGFSDLDGHRWNVLYMDMAKMPRE